MQTKRPRYGTNSALGSNNPKKQNIVMAKFIELDGVVLDSSGRFESEMHYVINIEHIIGVFWDKDFTRSRVVLSNNYDFLIEADTYKEVVKKLKNNV